MERIWLQLLRGGPLEEPLPDAREPAALELELVAREHETKPEIALDWDLKMSKTSKKLNVKVGNVLPNFGGHVLGCIEADFCKTNMRFAAFFKLYNICALLHRSKVKINE